LSVKPGRRHFLRLAAVKSCWSGANKFGGGGEFGGLGYYTKSEGVGL